MDSDCFCDFDPPTFSSIGIRKARKPHRCEECGNKIRPGDSYEYVAGMWEGCFSQFKTCEHCRDLRVWTMNNIPCLCWCYGNMDEDIKYAIDDAIIRAPDETRGLRFGLLRRISARDRFYKRRLAN